MKVACLQMDMKFGCTDENFSHAEDLICRAMKRKTRCPCSAGNMEYRILSKENLAELCCKDGK